MGAWGGAGPQAGIREPHGGSGVLTQGGRPRGSQPCPPGSEESLEGRAGAGGGTRRSEAGGLVCDGRGHLGAEARGPQGCPLSAPTKAAGRGLHARLGQTWSGLKTHPRAAFEKCLVPGDTEPPACRGVCGAGGTWGCIQGPEELEVPAPGLTSSGTEGGCPGPPASGTAPGLGGASGSPDLSLQPS